MYGISSTGKESIALAIDKMFDSLAYKLLGNIPKLKEKSPFFGSTPKFSLAHIFIQALGGKEPNHIERDVLRSILNSSHGYIESLKNKTSSHVMESVDALVKEAKIKGVYISSAQVAEVISAEMEKARNQMKIIAEAETTKTRNMAHLLDITKESMDENPTCFFIIVRDNLTCMEENELILTTKGAVPVGQIATGDILKNPSAPSQRGGNKVISVKKQQKETIELDFGETRIVCTKDHPILVRFGKILCFMEADRITEDHDVVMAHKMTKKGDLKMITRAKTPRKFMKDLGYSDAWDFWRENIDDILFIARSTKSRIPIMKKYGIDIPMWDQYVRYIIRGYDDSIEFIGNSPNNNFNTDSSRRKSKLLKNKRTEIYKELGADSWLLNQIKNGQKSSDLAKKNNLDLNFLRQRINELGLLPEIKARGGRSNWAKNRELLVKKGKERGTPHFNPISAPELALGTELSKSFSSLEFNVKISNIKVDFCITSDKIVIEYDGSGHNLKDKLSGNSTDKITNRTDFARDKLLKNLGYRVFRIKSPKDKFDSESIIDSIKKFINSTKVYDTWQS